MSVKKTTTIKGIQSEFIFRLEKTSVFSKPGRRYIVVNGSAYSNEQAKTAGNMIDSISCDLESPAISAAIDALMTACYNELKKTGQVLDGGTDC